MEQSVESNSFEKFKAIKSLLILLPYFRFFCKKKRFLLKSSKPGHENLVLITSTVQIELSTLNFNFDDKRNNFNFTFFFQILFKFILQVLKYYVFSRLLWYEDARQN